MSSKTSKRRRTDNTVTHISDLPVGILVDVSAYLSKPSRALLAVALTAPSYCQDDNLMHRPSPISKAIVSAQQWDTLDMFDIEKSLANRLSDDDVNAILQCISAHDVLKKLKLTGCISITGRGLSPLWGSVVLEQIDLSLLKQYDKPDDSETHYSLNVEIVLPILDSIISSMGCSLKHILLPYNWKSIDSNSYTSLEQFISRYNRVLNDRRINCSNCTKSIQGNQWLTSFDLYHYNTCYDCLKSYCDECYEQTHLNSCGSCKKDYCKDCDIDVAAKYKCTGCMKLFKQEIASLF